MDPDRAACEAGRLFGNVTALRETTRAMWGFPAAESVAADVRYGLRMFRRHPLVTVVALASLAAAVAASTALFSLLNSAMFRPLPGSDGAPVHRVFTSDSDGSPYGGSSYADYLAIAAQRRLFSESCATTIVRANVRAAGQPRSSAGQVADAGCFTLLRLVPAAGRFYGSADAASTPVIISYVLWQREFGGHLDAIGHQLLVNGVTATIVGVAPRGFAGTSLDSGAEFWISPHVASAFMPASMLTSRGYRAFTIYVRLAPGVVRAQADAALAVLAAQLRAVDPRSWTDASGVTRRLTVLDELEARFASSQNATAALVGGVAAAITLVIGIACVNLATMLLAVGVTRTREINVRLALGASRRRVLRQIVTESMLLGVCGAGVGLLVLHVAGNILDAHRPVGMPALDLSIDWRVAGVAISLALLTPLAFGLPPALHALRLAMAEGVRTGRRSAHSARVGRRGREILIVVQVATSCALLLMSTLFGRGLTDARATDLGFSTENIAAIEVDLHLLDTSEDALRHAMARLLDRAAAVDGVDGATTAGVVPLTGATTSFAARLESDPASVQRTFYGNVVGRGYFDLLGTPVRTGRDFDSRDSASAPAVAIVNMALSRALWSSDAALGRRIVLGRGRRAEVVGIVADTPYRRAGEKPEPLLFVPFDQHPQPSAVIHARMRGTDAVVAVERAVRGVDSRITFGRIGTVGNWIEAARAPERALQWGGAAAGAMQLALALMGLWALVAYAVQRRTVEMGLRLAFGATPAGLVALLMRPSLALILAGVALGIPAGLAGAALLRSTASGLRPLDLALCLPVAVALLVAASIAAWLPARRVAFADPSAALRHE